MPLSYFASSARLHGRMDFQKGAPLPRDTLTSADAKHDAKTEPPGNAAIGPFRSAPGSGPVPATSSPYAEGRPHSWWRDLGAVLGILGILIAILAWLFPDEGKAVVHETVKFCSSLNLFGWLLVVLILVAIGALTSLWRSRTLHVTKDNLKKKTRELEDLKRDLEDLKRDVDTVIEGLAEAREVSRPLDTVEGKRLQEELSEYIPYKKEPRQGWQSIKALTYGHLEYEPFLRYSGASGTPTGIGLDLLNTLLAPSGGGAKISLQPEKFQRSWNDIVKGLAENKYDIVATPLFATFERSAEVRFTAPLFFSNIGLYVNADLAGDTFWKHIKTATLRKDIRERCGNLRFQYVPGEISEKLAKKYVDPEQVVPSDVSRPGTKIVLNSIFDDIASSQDPPYAIFCESYYAHHMQAVQDKRVVNALPCHQILYPVCFAVRQGDYQLANLINIRLLQFTRNRGALDLLIETLAKSEKPMDKDKVKCHFIAEWPSDLKPEDCLDA